MGKWEIHPSPRPNPLTDRHQKLHTRLGPLLFLLFINDIDEGIANRLLKFADDTKLVDTVSSDLEIEQLHSDLKQLHDWSLDWQMGGETENAGTENAAVEISARHCKKRQGVENAGVEMSARYCRRWKMQE